MRIPRIVRDLQVERERNFFSQRLFHGLDLLFAQGRQELSFRTVVSDAMSCDHNGQGHVQVLMDDGLASGQSIAPVSSLELHDQVMKTYGVVPIDGALVALRKPHFQVSVPAGDQ